MSGLQFSVEAARQLARLYLTSDAGQQHRRKHRVDLYWSHLPQRTIAILAGSADAYSKDLAVLIMDFVGRRNDISSDDLHDWYEEFARLSEAGRSAAIDTRCQNLRCAGAMTKSSPGPRLVPAAKVKCHHSRP